MKTPIPEYYLGTIQKVLDPDKYEVEIQIPGVTEQAKAFPMRGESDEPKPGDLCLILGLDPVYHSVYFYQKLKENEYIGFRSRGKKVDITKKRIEIGIFSETQDAEATEAPYKEDETPESTSWIRIDESGNIDINAEGNQKIHITGDSEVTVDGTSKVTISGETEVNIDCDTKVTISGKADIKVSSDCNIEVSGDCTLKSPNVKVTGGNLETSGGGSCSATGQGGFCGIPVCPFTGAPHVGNKISGT